MVPTATPSQSSVPRTINWVCYLLVMFTLSQTFLWKVHMLYVIDEAGIPCAKTSPSKSPAKSANNNDADEDFSYSYQSYHNNHHTGYGKGRGRGGKRGFHRQGPSSER